MNTDIEDFINTKNKMGPDDYNNFDVSLWDVKGIKNIFNNLLIWLGENNELLNVSDNNLLYKKFESELNKEMRKSKIQGLRKSILLNVLNNVLTMNDFQEGLRDNFKIMKNFPLSHYDPVIQIISQKLIRSI